MEEQALNHRAPTPVVTEDETSDTEEPAQYHVYPALVVSSPSSDSAMMSPQHYHPRLVRSHDDLAAQMCIRPSSMPHAGVGLHTACAFSAGEAVICMRRSRHVRSWKDAEAWVSINKHKGTDVVIRLNSRSYFLDDAICISEFGDSYHHCPWRAVNDAYQKPSNVVWQIFRVSPRTGGAAAPRSSQLGLQLVGARG